MRILIVVLSDKMVHEERLATSRSFEQYSSPISMLLKARCGRFAFACTFVFPTKRFKFARIKSIDNEALLRQLVQSSQKKVPLFFTTDRLVQILDFGEVSTDRQVLSRVIRKVLSNSKHTLLCLCGHNVLEILLLYNKVQISSVYPQFASSDSIRCKRLWRYATLFCNSCFR